MTGDELGDGDRDDALYLRQGRERGETHGALPAQRDDPRRVVAADDLQRPCELSEDGVLASIPSRNSKPPSSIATMLRRALELYGLDRLDFAETYLVASAETTGVGRIASFDRAINRVNTVERIEPAGR